jgi:hypothetical protein
MSSYEERLLGLGQLKEARCCHAPVQNIMSCDRSLDFGVKKYVIF